MNEENVLSKIAALDNRLTCCQGKVALLMDIIFSVIVVSFNHKQWLEELFAAEAFDSSRN